VNQTDRDAWERRLRREIGRLSTQQQEVLLKKLGTPPHFERLTPEFWQSYEDDWRAVMTPELERVFVDAAQAQAADWGGVGAAVDWTGINRGALEWSRAYGYSLVKEIRQNTENALQALEVLQREIPGYFETPTARRDLVARLSRWFGPQRAEMIATTEVTRASVRGEMAAVEDLRRDGYEFVTIWQTNNDELVCPICGPKHGKPITDGEYPPAHVNCRCWVTNELQRREP